MKTLLEHIDDLDRMIEAGNTPIDKLRSQLAFIGREVTALQTEYAGLYQAHSELYAGLEERIAKFQERDKKAMRDLIQQQSAKNQKFWRSGELNN